MDRFAFRLALVYLIDGHFVDQGHYSLVNVSLLLTKKASFISHSFDNSRINYYYQIP